MSVTIPALPPAPNRGSAPDDYIQTADNWAAALPGFTVAMNALGAEAEANAATAQAAKNAALSAQQAASDSAQQAAASALSAVNSPGTTATSTTPNTVSLGAKSFTVQAGKSWVVGQFVVMAYTASPDNYMVGQITAYNATTGALAVDSVAIKGTGSWSNWSIGLSAPYINPNDDFVALSVLGFLYN